MIVLRRFERPYLRVAVRDGCGRVLLRLHEPPGRQRFWAPPGESLDAGEPLPAAARRVLRACGLDAAELRLLLGRSSGATVEAGEILHHDEPLLAATVPGCPPDRPDGHRWWPLNHLPGDVRPGDLAALLGALRPDGDGS